MEGWRKEKEEIIGGKCKPQLDPQEISPIYLHSPLLYPSDNSLQKLGQESSTFYQQCVFQTERAEVRSRNSLTRLQTEPTSHLQALA